MTRHGPKTSKMHVGLGFIYLNNIVKILLLSFLRFFYNIFEALFYSSNRPVLVTLKFLLENPVGNSRKNMYTWRPLPSFFKVRQLCTFLRSQYTLVMKNICNNMPVVS